MRQIFIVGLLLCGFWGFAQDREDFRERLPTENLEVRKDANKKSNTPKRKKIALIYVPNANKIMYGNACATQETHRMGFEYIVEPKNISGSKTKMGKRLNNLWVKSKLVVTRTPFWKVILNGKIKKCRKMSADIVG